MSFVGPCSFMTNVSLLAISNSKLTIDMFGRVLPGGSYPTLKAWTRDLSPEPKEFPSGDCMVAIDNDQIVQRKWKVKVGQKARVSVVTIIKLRLTLEGPCKQEEILIQGNTNAVIVSISGNYNYCQPV